MSQAINKNAKIYHNGSDVAIVILRIDDQERLFFEYVTPTLGDFFNCNLVNIIGRDVYEVFPYLPEDLYLMAKNVVLRGERDEYIANDVILQEPIRITCYQSEPGYCTCFIERYSDVVREYEHRLRSITFQSLVEEASNVVVWYNINTNKVRFHKIDALFWNLQAIQTDFIKKIVNLEIVHPQYKKQFLKLVKIAHNKKTASGDILIKNNKGNYLYANVIIYYHYDSNPDFTTLMIMIKDIQKEKQDAERIQWLAERDRLTELYNRGAIEDLIRKNLSRTRNKNDNVAIIIIDMDNFRDANNYYGHLFGDKVLIEYSKQLTSILPKDTLIARTGGDEFLIYLAKVVDEEEVIDKMKQIIQINHKLLILPHKEFQISTSIGAAIAKKAEANFPDLYMNADIALYSVKNKGGNSYEIFDESAELNKLNLINEEVIKATEQYNPIFLSPYSRLFPQMRKKIYRLLSLMAHNFGFNRIYIVNQNNYIEQIWHEPNISNLVVNFDSIGIHESVKEKRIIFFDDIKDDYPTSQEIANVMGIKSSVFVALFDQDSYLGYMGCNDCCNKREFTEEDLKCLRHFSDFLAILMQTGDL